MQVFPERVKPGIQSVHRVRVLSQAKQPYVQGEQVAPTRVKV